MSSKIQELSTSTGTSQEHLVECTNVHSDSRISDKSGSQMMMIIAR